MKIMAKNIKSTEQKVVDELGRRGITLSNFKDITRKTLYKDEFSLPAHNEKTWLREYIKDCIKEGMSPEEIMPLARKSYALLRYKQALTGSSDGTKIGAFLAMHHVPDDGAKEVYDEALNEFDSKGMLESASRKIRYSRSLPRITLDASVSFSYDEARRNGHNFYVHEEA